MATYFGFNPPFIGGQQNILSRQEDVQLIKNDILQLLLTSPGDRVNRPTFGTPLRSFVFENNTDADLQLLTQDISEAIVKFEPRVDIVQLDIAQSQNDNGIRIYLVVQLRDNPNVQLTIDRFIQSQSE